MASTSLGMTWNSDDYDSGVALEDDIVHATAEWTMAHHEAPKETVYHDIQAELSSDSIPSRK